MGIAIWGADETMQRAVDKIDNPTNFYAQAIMRSETARPPEQIKEKG
jgi:hypothetical protein